MRRTKIVCTLGPATDNDKVLEELINAGMDVARVNVSHGGFEPQLPRINSVKRLREKLKKPIPVMLDTRGPEIRVKTFKNGSVEIKQGQTFTFTAEDCEGDAERVSISYSGLPQKLRRGDKILLDDGLIAFIVESTTETDVVCTAVDSGVLSNRKSMNIPGVHIDMVYVGKDDRKDILLGIENDVDFIAASFVRSSFDVLEIRKLLDENGGKNIKIIAKIENSEGVENIDDILRISDGIMVARGDMGVEIPFEELPGLQKMLIKKCYMAGKVVITATQMLDSMIRNPRPTRAETTDVANAVYEGTSALMLSGETSVGKNPVLVVQTMAKIAERTEGDYFNTVFDSEKIQSPNVTDALSHATCTTAADLGAAAILAVTKSGTTARMISKFRPQNPIIATTTSEKAYRQLNLSWGVIPLRSEEKYTTDDLFDHAVDLSVEAGLVKNGDIVVITAGVPVGISGNTNILKVHLVGHVLVQGSSVNGLSASGNVCVAKTDAEAASKFKDGDILAITRTTNELIDVLKHASGIITEEDGISSHGAIVGMALNIPVITGARGATSVLKTGTTITMDSSRGLVYSGVVKTK